MTTNLPVEWREELSGVPEVSLRKFKDMMNRGLVSPLSEDDATPHLLLFLTGESLDAIAERTSTPKDVIYLTAISHNWSVKKAKVDQMGGSESVLHALRKQLLNNILIATTKASLKDVGDVMAGKTPASKMPLIPRSLHALNSLFQMIDDANKPPESATAQNNVIHAENVQINNQVTAPVEGVIRIPKADRLKQLASKDKK